LITSEEKSSMRVGLRISEAHRSDAGKGHKNSMQQCNERERWDDAEGSWGGKKEGGGMKAAPHRGKG